MISSAKTQKRSVNQILYYTEVGRNVVANLDTSKLTGLLHQPEDSTPQDLRHTKS